MNMTPEEARAWLDENMTWAFSDDDESDEEIE